MKIPNRHGQQVAVLVEQADPQKGLAFVMHGLGGFKEQPHIRVMAEELLKVGYTVVTFDTTNTFGESDGNYADATVTNYYADFEDVLAWAATQPWYQEPFLLAGHSLGGMCILLYAETHLEKVKALAPSAPAVSGQLTYDYQLKTNSERLQTWQETGWDIRPSNSKPGIMKKLKWTHIEDRLKYDTLPEADKLTMPVFIVVGSEDDSCPPEHQQLLYEKLAGPKELHVVDGMPHTPRSEKDLGTLRTLFAEWAKKVA